VVAKFVYFVVFADLLGHADTAVLSLNLAVAKLAVDDLFVVAGGTDAVPAFMGLHAFGTHLTVGPQSAHTYTLVGDDDGAVSEAFAQLVDVERLRRFGQPIAQCDLLGGVQF